MEELRVIDLVLPCYNPPPGWDKRVVACLNNFSKRCDTVRFRVFIVSDGSVRGFEDSVFLYLNEKIKDVEIIRYQENRGKGYALRTAIKRCASEFIIYTDYDFPYVEDSFYDVVEALLSKDSDIIVAVRAANYRKNLPPVRRILSKSSHLCNRWILGLEIVDTQGGLKAFTARGRDIFLQTRVNGFLFDTEFIYRAKKNHLRIKQITARIRNDIQVSNFGFGIMKQEIENFITIIRHR